MDTFIIEFDINDYTIDDYNLDVIQQSMKFSKDTQFGFTCLILHSIRTNNKDLKDLISNISLSEESDFITIQVMAFASGRVGLHEQALEWGKMANTALQALSQVTGISYNRCVSLNFNILRRLEELKYFVASTLLCIGGSCLAESLSIYRNLLEKNPSSHHALFGICEIYIRLQNWKVAAEYAEKCLEYDKNNHQALAARGWAAFHQNDLDLALRLIKQANSLHQDASSLYKLGRIYWEMGGIITI